jgi:hypothetical protein
VIARRRFGATAVELSTLAFGSMRLPAAASDDALVGLLLTLVDAGVTTLHSSSEYDTFPRFCALLAQVRAARPAVAFEHVIKLAEPHFDSDRFDPASFERKLDDYRRALAADRIDVVQWMLRFDLKQEERRLEILDRDSAAIGAAVDAAGGRLGAMACFPYTLGFARRVLAQPWCHGMVDYLNPLETESMEYVSSIGDRGFIALRPLAAGKIAPEQVADAQRFPLVSSDAHARAAIAALS